jgi:curli production assembly/transport component CsgE
LRLCPASKIIQVIIVLQSKEITKTKNMTMRNVNIIPVRFLIAVSIIFLLCPFAICQNSDNTIGNNSKKDFQNINKTSNGVIIQTSDSLKAGSDKKNEDNVIAQDTSKSNGRYLDETLAIGGLVIDHTQSKWGRDFVDLFNKSFNPPEKFNDYTIVIEEKPLPQFGTLILMKVNGNYVYQRFIQPRYQTIKLNAEQASGIALQYIVNYQQIQKDLQGEDLKGTGIF